MIFIASLAVSALFSPAGAATDRLNITAEEHVACDADAVRLCMSTYPDETRLLSCMKTNVHQLTPICQVTFEAGMKRRHLNL